MSTPLLCRANAYQRTFEARLVRLVTYAGCPAAVLDQTAFYPTSGGQPCDHGTLNGVTVHDVRLEDDGTVVHMLGGLLEASIGATVHGEIDWPRRFDHMQQHTGQHILSQAFARVASLETRSVHIGSEENTIDLDTPSMPLVDVVRAVEAEANRVVFEDLPVHVYVASDAALSQLPLRRPPQLKGDVRIVEIAGYDWSACGGTHVRNTAQVGAIKIVRVERHKGGARVTFRCGWRALADYSRVHEIISALSAALSAPRYDVAAAALRILGEARQIRQELEAVRSKLRAHEARALLDTAVLDAQQRRWVVHIDRDATVEELRALAQTLTERSDVIALLARAGAPAHIIIARSEHLSLDAAALLRQVLSQLAKDSSAKGGGGARFAQGGGFAADANALHAALHALVALHTR
ncbi:MAG: alanyl-tRNA editing protein [Thermoflexales bacterium]